MAGSLRHITSYPIVVVFMSTSRPLTTGQERDVLIQSTEVLSKIFTGEELRGWIVTTWDTTKELCPTAAASVWLSRLR